jgi:hypothetical protein
VHLLGSHCALKGFKEKKKKKNLSVLGDMDHEFDHEDFSDEDFGGDMYEEDAGSEAEADVWEDDSHIQPMEESQSDSDGDEEDVSDCAPFCLMKISSHVAGFR